MSLRLPNPPLKSGPAPSTPACPNWSYLAFLSASLSTEYASAAYLEDTTLGEGKTTVKVEVKAGEHSVTFTIRTDRTILGDALTDHNLIEGENGAYGLYVKKVNGITADYDVDQSYWGFYKNGEYMMTGVDTTTIADGEHYELVYEK